MSATRTYDPGLYDAILGGRRLNEGVAEGTFLTLTPEAQRYTDKVSVTEGDVSRARSHDKRQTLKIVVNQTSEVNDFLSGLVAADDAAENGASVASFTLIDRGGTTVISASKAWIQKLPEVTLAEETEGREWEIRLADAKFFLGGNPAE